MEKDSNEKKAPAYLTKISSETFDKLKEQLLQLMVVEKKYRDRHFSACGQALCWLAYGRNIGYGGIR